MGRGGGTTDKGSDCETALGGLFSKSAPLPLLCAGARAKSEMSSSRPQILGPSCGNKPEGATATLGTRALSRLVGTGASWGSSGLAFF